MMVELLLYMLKWYRLFTHRIVYMDIMAYICQSHYTPHTRPSSRESSVAEYTLSTRK
jgi:hypothetical protein